MYYITILKDNTSLTNNIFCAHIVKNWSSRRGIICEFIYITFAIYQNTFFKYSTTVSSKGINLLFAFNSSAK